MGRKDNVRSDPPAVDYEAAADIFVSIFPGASPEEVYDNAVSGARNAAALGFDHEALVLQKTAAILLRRLSN